MANDRTMRDAIDRVAGRMVEADRKRGGRLSYDEARRDARKRGARYERKKRGR